MGRFGHCLPSTTILTPRDGPMQEVATESLLKDENADRDVIRVPGPPNAHQRGEVMARETREYKKERNKQDPADIIKQKPGHDLPGYMPLREDFDVEHENDAETYLADMEFLPDDHPGERELKLAVIKIYNAKLDEREKRKEFVQKRGLVDFKKQQAAERRRTKEERELTARLRVFARFHFPEEHEALVDGILKVRKLRKQIELYKVSDRVVWTPWLMSVHGCGADNVHGCCLLANNSTTEAWDVEPCKRCSNMKLIGNDESRM